MPGIITSATMICGRDRKSTRLNSSHVRISYAVFCVKKKNHVTVLSAPVQELQGAPAYHVQTAVDEGVRLISVFNRPSRFNDPLFFLMIRRPPSTPLFPYTTLFRTSPGSSPARPRSRRGGCASAPRAGGPGRDRKSTRLNSIHVRISYAVFCLKKKKKQVIKNLLSNAIKYNQQRSVTFT